jgi:kynureninase
VKTPVDPTRRGSHVSLGHPDALGIDLALIEEFGVLPDFRPPDHIRLGVAPLYTRFADIDTAVAAMTTIVAEDRHRKYSAARPTVV